MSHTPGPWKLHDGETSVLGADGELVATCGFLPRRDIGDVKANARLTTSAPTMLEVLEEVEECSRYWSEYDVPLGLHDRIKSAIAKARGRL